ncbi:MarR family winged helix-turn-helix transcriptional regulator [Palleronia abyssalis]|uniref:Putative HTH-type transcriptional regulator/GBAA_1941/BAS1801 n=1 Tax=Palleronia abyssalis TaxID=1501240 RepID=A0A2R8BS17_9RHOB|nr:MarR family transcriptional regulator [Palleronia abyssalis]SPJ22959.1 putative HTH-type transcriptional regulator/GBAA_1941/BAS1801 [Palleronia abyssalis]
MPDNDASNSVRDATGSGATEAWLAVAQAYNECTATLLQHLRPLGLSLLEHEVLMNLLRSDGLTQRELSQRCFSAKSGISMLISRLEGSGIIVRSQSLQDQRAWRLSLTPKGQSLAQDALRIQTKVVAEMAKAFSRDELAVVKSRMNAAAALLKDMREQKRL